MTLAADIREAHSAGLGVLELAEVHGLTPAVIRRILARTGRQGRVPSGDSLESWARANGQEPRRFARMCFELVRRDYAAYGLVKP